MEFSAADGGTPNLRFETDHNFHHVILSGLQGKIPLTIFPSGILVLHSCCWKRLNGSAALSAHLNLTLLLGANILPYGKEMPQSSRAAHTLKFRSFFRADGRIGGCNEAICWRCMKRAFASVPLVR